MHVDLERYSDKTYSADVITKNVNKKLQEWNYQLRILKTTPVHDEFHSRFSVINRTYLYRLAIAKKQHSKDVPIKLVKAQMFIPIEENHRCHFIL